MKLTKKEPLYSFKHEPHSLETLFVNVEWKDIDKKHFSFDINPECPLLEEHFPNFPIVPASLIVGLMSEINQKITEEKQNSNLSVENIRLNLPVTPGNNYNCVFKGQGKKGILFTISDSNNAVYTRGILNIINQNRNSILKNEGVNHAA